MKKIILTGGGTAGHVTPNLALIPKLKEEGYEIYYIGSYDGIEKELIQAEGIPYYGIATGKLRRYFSWKNFSDPFRVIKGFFEAQKYIREIKPDVVFSKGGFVSVPVVFAAKKRKVPAILHESDLTPGLANKLCIPKAEKICANFPETIKYLPEGKAILTGSPIREILFKGNREKGLVFAGLDTKENAKPVLLVTGGSTGSVKINESVRDVLPTLLKDWQVIHLCGKGKADPKYENISGYRQIEYVREEMPDVFAASDLIVSRAGANAICEFVALHKPNVLIPLSLNASRGDQLLNAESFEKQGFSAVLREEDLTPETLMETITKTYENRDKYIEAMEHSSQSTAIETIVKLIKETTV